MPPPVWSPESDYTAGLAEAGEPAEDEAGDGEALHVYRDPEDGKKYAVHPFGHTYGLDDAGEI